MFMDKKIKYCKIPVLIKFIHRFNSIPIKVLASDFVHINKLILKCIQKGRRPRTTSTILKQNNKNGGLTLPGVKTY